MRGRAVRRRSFPHGARRVRDAAESSFQMAIQWFPGHMHTTRKAIAERLPDIDVVRSKSVV